MGNRWFVSVLLVFLLFCAGLFAQGGSGSDWQYANVFNVVNGGYGTWIPSWYTTDFSTVSSFTPVTPNLRTAFMRSPDGTDEIPVPINHDQVVLRVDILSGTEDKELRGITLHIWGSPDFDPNEDLAPIYPDTARDLFCVPDTIEDYYTGMQFYIEKGHLAGSNVDSLDDRDIEGIPEQLLLDTLFVQNGPSTVVDTLPPAYHWNRTSPVMGTAPHPGWKQWDATIYFKDGIRIPYEGTFNRTEYGLPFYRIWVVMKPMGCHRCISGSHLGGFVEGFSNRDSLYMEVREVNDLQVYRLLGVNPTTGMQIVDDVDMTLGRDYVRRDYSAPVLPLAERWARSELLYGGDTIPPFITDLVPRNEVPTNGDTTDQGCDEFGPEIWTADSCQPISFVAYDKATCIDSVFVELRYINPGIPTFFPRRVDSIYYRSQLSLAPEDTNGGPGKAWQVNIRPYLGAWTGWLGVLDTASEFEVIQSGPCADGYCGHDTFFIDIGNDVVQDHLDPFIDGSWVQVTVRVFNRNYNRLGDMHIFHSAYDAYQDTVWNFFVDLSGPNAELICPSTTDDDLTQEFYGGAPGWRQDFIEGENIDWTFISDSLPLLQVHLYDDYADVHDADHHDDPLPFYTGAQGGCGINERDFQFTFVLHRLVCDESRPYYVYDTFYVTEDDLDEGCWFDEHVNGEEGTMWVDFEDLFTYRVDLTGTYLDGDPLIPFRSGDIVEVQMTQLFDDPDYGQGSQRLARWSAFHCGTSDLVMEGSYCSGPANPPDGNYGTQHRREENGDSHIPVDSLAAECYDVQHMVDTLAFLRIDLAGPVSPDTFFYPANGWVTSDTLQVITVDIYDQIGCPTIDENVHGNVLDDYVAGVYSGTTDTECRIAINLTVRGCDDVYNPAYVASAARPWEGKTWYVPGWTTTCASNPLHVEKIQDHWGTRLTFAPEHVAAGSGYTNGKFRSGDKVCVTVYAWDNAVTDCPYDTNFTTNLTCADGSVWETVDNYIPGRNEGVDKLDPDWLHRTVRQIARYTFFVDVTPPKFVTSKIYPICDDTLTFDLRDYSDAVGPVWCDDWVAGIGAADLRIWIYDDEGDDDFVFFNDLVPSVPVGATQIDTTTMLIDREDRYIYARMDFGDDPAREGQIKVWKDCNAPSCHFFEPGDSVVVEIWAGDNPNTPWYAATQRPIAEEGYHANMIHTMTGHQQWWWHYYNPTFPLISGDDYWMSPCAGWRRGARVYTNDNHDTTGIAWEDTVLYNYENPNWDQIHTESFIVQSEIWIKEALWFNDSAYAKYTDAGFGTSKFFNYPPDLHGKYIDMFEVPDTSLDVFSVFTDDVDVDTFARDLQFFTAEIYTCTDSLIWECLAGSSYPEDTLTDRTPHVTYDLYNAAGTLVWSRDEYYDCHCVACFLHYEPLRECCKDGGIIKFGPVNQLHEYMTTVRDTVHTMADIHPDQRYVVGPIVDEDTTYYVYGYMNGDHIEVTFGIHSRNPNQFNDPDLNNNDYHEYRWFYNIDMQPPTALYRDLEGTRGYEEVDCAMMHVDNNQIRLRLEDIRDRGVGLEPYGTDPLWTSNWPAPILKPATDWVKYRMLSGDPEVGGLVYNPGTHYIYSNEAHVVQNCAEELHVARSMTIPAITMYSGLDADRHPVERVITSDTIMIADSLYAEAVLEDKLGNERYLHSDNLGLDNGLPEVKGFCFATFDPATDRFNNWDRSNLLLPWEVPEQESLVGVYNFGAPGEVCTVFVRLWFSDNMDMREADTHTGYIVRFQPEGWTHWFPVMPIPTHAGYYTLANRYVDYSYGVHGAHLRSADPASTADFSDDAEAMLYDDGWNTDREWIGYMIVAGDDMMDGVATLRVQGFDDNAGNTMLERDFKFRIESQFIDPCLRWPEIDMYDTDPVDLTTGASDDALVLTGYSEGDFFCSFEPTTDCYPVTAGCFDRTITDSVAFEFWWSDESPSDTIPSDAPDFRYSIDDMEESPNIWPDVDGETWWARTPCDVIDILHEYADGGSLLPLAGMEKYLTIRFRAYSRFYPSFYVQDITWNVLIDNKNNPVDFTTAHSGDIRPGFDLITIPAVTSHTRICVTGTDADQVDYVNFVLVDMITDARYPLTDDVAPYDDDFDQVGREGIDPVYFNASDNAICFDWNTPDGITPGLYRICATGYDAIHVVTDYNYETGTITGYNSYQHNLCVCRDSIFIPSESFLARGDDYIDAIKTVCENYPSPTYPCDDIYPWDGANWYPDWPAWVNVDEEIVDGYPHVNRFQITTYDNPDYSEGDDPLLHPYTETGGYLGDSLYVLFRVQDIDSILLDISDEFGGRISGSNLEIIHMMYADHPADIREYDGASYFVYNWIVDDQDNRFDGPVKVKVTTYRQSYTGTTVATDHVTYILLDTYDPEYRVSMNRMDATSLRTCLSDEFPRDTIWVTNADTVNVRIDWDQTIFDQAPTAEGYIDYNEWAKGRIFEHLRMTIDGQPHSGFHTDDPNDVNQARLWQRDLVDLPTDGVVPFWLNPGTWPVFGDDIYSYRWTVSNDLNGQGLAKLLVKGRDVAGNILTYAEAELSRSFGKFTLVDVEAPAIDAAGIRITSAEFVAAPGSFDDNFLCEGYRDAISGGYVFVEVYDLAHTVLLTDTFWVNCDGSVDAGMVGLTAGDSVLVVATDLAGNQTTEVVVVVPHEECCTYDLCAGFNMVAVSVVPTDPSELLVENVFPGMDVYTLHGGIYTPVSTGTYLDNPTGYLVMATVPTTITVCGAPVESFEATGLTAGWNLIGGPWTTVLTADAGVYPSGAVSLENVHYYDCASSEYIPTEEFAHCRGHLVMVTSSDPTTIMVPDTASGAKVTYSVEKNNAASVDWVSSVDVRSGNAARSLTFGTARTATSGIELGYDVPMFPAFPGQADAYLDNHLAKSVVSSDNRAEWSLVMTDGADVTVDVSSIPDIYDVTLDGINLRETSTVKLEAGTHSLVTLLKAVPVNFSLEQNTPNPFNPVTSINYSVPSESRVTIEVFNVLGENLRTLVDEVQTAGNWTARWDGKNQKGEQMTSGVYFYKMTAGGFSATHKMTLVK